MIEDFNGIFCPDFTDEDNVKEWATLLGIFALGYNAAQKPQTETESIIKALGNGGIKPENIYDTLSETR